MRHSFSAVNLFATGMNESGSIHKRKASDQRKSTGKDSGVKFSREERKMHWLVHHHQLQTPAAHYKTNKSDFNISLPMKKSIHFGSCQVRDTSQFLFPQKGANTHETSSGAENPEMIRQKKRNSMLAVNSFSSPNIMKQFARNLEQSMPFSSNGPEKQQVDPEEEELRLLEQRRRARSVPLTRAARSIKKKVRKHLIKQHQEIMIQQSLLYQERIYGHKMRKRRHSIPVATKKPKPKKTKTANKKSSKKTKKQKENVSPATSEASSTGDSLLTPKTSIVTAIPQVSPAAPDTAPEATSESNTIATDKQSGSETSGTALSAPSTALPQKEPKELSTSMSSVTPEDRDTNDGSESSGAQSKTKKRKRKIKRRRLSMITSDMSTPYRIPTHPPAKPGSFSRSSSRDWSWLSTPASDNPIGPGDYDVEPYFKRQDSTKITHKIAKPVVRSERLSWGSTETPYHTALDSVPSSFHVDEPRRNTVFGSSQKRCSADRKIEDLWNLDIPPHVKRRESSRQNDRSFSILSKSIAQSDATL